MNARNLMIIGLVLFLFGCRNNTGDGLTTVEVKAVEQVANYTYLLVKDKGPEYWVAVIRPGRVIFELEGVPVNIAKAAFRLASNKLPIKTKFISIGKDGGSV